MQTLMRWQAFAQSMFGGRGERTPMLVMQICMVTKRLIMKCLPCQAFDGRIYESATATGLETS